MASYYLDSAILVGFSNYTASYYLPSNVVTSIVATYHVTWTRIIGSDGIKMAPQKLNDQNATPQFSTLILLLTSRIQRTTFIPERGTNNHVIHPLQLL